jgi:hypothetical protein
LLLEDSLVGGAFCGGAAVFSGANGGTGCCGC